MRKSKIVSFLLIIVLIMVLISGKNLFIYLSTYTITPKKTELEDAILSRINRPATYVNNIEIMQELNLDNKKYVLIVMRGSEGDAEFTKGFNHKYKLENVGYGSSLFRTEIMKTNKGKYIVMLCKNSNNKIKYAKVLLDNQEYKINIPKEKFVIAYCKAPSDTKVNFVDISNIKFYSNDDKDITQDTLQKQ